MAGVRDRAAQPIVQKRARISPAMAVVSDLVEDPVAAEPVATAPVVAAPVAVEVKPEPVIRKATAASLTTPKFGRVPRGSRSGFSTQMDNLLREELGEYLRASNEPLVDVTERAIRIFLALQRGDVELADR